MKTRGFFTVILCITVIAIVGLLWMNERHAVRELRIAVGPRVGYSYQLGDALSRVIGATEPHIRLVLQETKGAQENVDGINSGRVDLAIAPVGVSVGRDVRAIAILFTESYHLMVRAKSGIASVEDLKGRCVLIPPRGTESYRDFHILMRHYGMREEDMTVKEIKSLQWKDNVEHEIKLGGIDAVFASVPVGEPLVRKLLSGGKWRLLPIVQVAAMRIRDPYIVACVIPRGTYRAAGPAVPDRDLETVGIPTALLVRSDVDGWVVNGLTRILFEHQNALIAVTPLAIFISAPDKSQAIGLPAMHKGALAYYNRERPDIIKRYYNEICFFFTLGPMLLSVTVAVRSRLQSRRLRRIDEYTRKIAELFMGIESSADLQSLVGLERNLLKLFADSLKDLEQGRLTTNDIQSLSMIWDKAIAAVHHRQSVWAGKG